MTGLGEVPRGASSIRPEVARARGGLGVWLFAVTALMAGVALFLVLENHRASVKAPPVAVTDAVEPAIVLASPPDFTVPAEHPPPLPQPQYPSAPTPQLAPSGAPQFSGGRALYGGVHLTPPTAAVRVQGPPPTPSAPPATSLPPLAPPPRGPEVVFDASHGRPTAALASSTEAGQAKNERVSASRFANPATTVPKGTVMQAVLESALDSTRPGLARAIITRDVYGFDGGRVLIPRGSRLIGEYKADLAQGQSRALIQWQRLMRPDGVLVNLDSPSADPLGRAGVAGKVNTHFIERYSDAALQSAINIGTEIGVSKLTNGATIYAIPLGGQGAPSIAPDKATPTLTVKQGASVSVFVARDLDFTSVEP